MEKVDLKAEDRKEIGKKVKHLRSKGLLPAVVYGSDFKTVSLSLDAKTYKRVISGDAGTNVIINLSIAPCLPAGRGGQAGSLPVITHRIQHNPLTDEIIHVDFFKINMKEKIQTRIPLEIIGTALGVKQESGILVNPLTELEIKCLPMDIPPKLEVDVSALKIGDSIHVSDLRSKLKADVEIITGETETVAQVIPPAKEEEVVVAPAAEGEIPAAGAAAAPAAAPVEGKPAAEPETAKPEAAAVPAKGGAGGKKPSKKPEK